MGTDPAGEKVKDQLKRLAPLLQDKTVSSEDKMRLILLYIIHKGGDTQRTNSSACYASLAHVLLRLFTHSTNDCRLLMTSLNRLVYPRDYHILSHVIFKKWGNFLHC